MTLRLTAHVFGVVVLTAFVSSLLFRNISAASAPHNIVNGTDAALNQFPFMVSLQWNGQHKCGGTLLNSKLVLTAAHCYPLVFVESNWKQKVTVVAGTLQLTDQTATRSKVKKVFWHPDIPDKWHGPQIKNEAANSFERYKDFIILQLKTPIVASPPSIAYARLGDKSGSLTPNVGDRCTAIGWGRYQTEEYSEDPKVMYAETFSPTLQVGQMYVISKDECETTWNLPQSMSLLSDHICMQQVFEGGQGKGNPCFGDSGGPLICRDGNTPYVAAIVLGGALPCDPNGLPVLFTRISVGRDFIDSTMAKYSDGL